MNGQTQKSGPGQLPDDKNSKEKKIKAIQFKIEKIGIEHVTKSK